jgi:hypothetical protein
MRAKILLLFLVVLFASAIIAGTNGGWTWDMSTGWTWDGTDAGDGSAGAPTP